MLKWFTHIIHPIKLATASLKMHKGRTVLTVVGVVIGITTIIIILSIGTGLKNLILDQLGSFGNDTIFVEYKVPDTSDVNQAIMIGSGININTLKIKEADALKDKERYPDIEDVYSVQIGQNYVVHEGNELKAMIWATNPSFVTIDDTNVENGRFFTDDEEKGLSKVCAIGPTVAKRLFGDEDPIGKFLRFENKNWKIVGVMEPRGMYMTYNFDKFVYVPLETYRKLVSGMDYIPYFVVKIAPGADAEIVKKEVTNYMWEEHDIENKKDEDFRITTMDEAMDMVDAILGGIRLLLGAIAAISLLVGGIGIMNIMLVSVSERTHEIGLRKAVGARRSSILSQFLWEAVVVTLLGGIIGIIFGFLITYLITFGANYAGYEWKFNFSYAAMIMGLIVSVTSGIIFGLYPAWKAAKMDPIEALRKD